MRDRIVIVIDDGLDTGATMRASVRSVLCPCEPETFCGGGLDYEDFAWTLDEEVAEILQQYHRPAAERAE
jgi:predicted phosphoribosyltransferase